MLPCTQTEYAEALGECQKLGDPRTMPAWRHYLKCRWDGTSHNLALMFALQQPPQTSGTDSVFLEGRCNGNQFEATPHLGDYYKREAEAAGVDVKGKVYLSGLARFPGDPEAWVSGSGDVRSVCEQRGWGCRGAVNVKAQDAVAPPADVPVAEDIVDHHAATVLEENGVPATDTRTMQEVREAVKDALTPHWAA